ncbi:hypothetical protein [Pollutibacter soli]|uniref:hypothetical protein n=1 Tax=Pollutibacter soli TaxID=3034157 RepID=UPI0030132E81
MNNFYSTYKNTKKEKFNYYKSEFRARVSEARNRDKVIETYFDTFFRQPFGEIQNKLSLNMNIPNNAKNNYERDRKISLEAAYNFEFAQINSEKIEEVIENLAAWQAIIEFQAFLETKKISIQNKKVSKKSNDQRSNIIWKGENETELIHLIYAMFHGDFISCKPNRIDSVVQSICTAFNYELGKNWKSNHSKSIHNRKNDYQIQIFDKLKSSYILYANSQKQNRAKNKAK